MAWVDYKKAYDSVPHSWLIRCLDLYKISPTIKKFLAHQMKKWKTNITLKHNNGDMQIPDVKIRRGILISLAKCFAQPSELGPSENDPRYWARVRVSN